jgi:UMF1 family MFS transporter
MFSPQAKSGEFLGLWGLAGKFAAVLGIILFGTLQTIFSLKTAMLACCTFFILGLLINQTVNEKAGIARAKKG